MRKNLATFLSAAVLLTAVAQSAQAANADPGGTKGFFTGCCLGLRVGADYNDNGTGGREFLPWFLVGVCLGPRTQMDYSEGKEFHWREVARVIPYVGAVFMIWDGVDISGGKGRTDLQDRYGANYY
jgi:hypothetical protein